MKSNISDVSTVFRPSSPMKNREFFIGRIDELDKIQDEIEEPGAHIAVYGERGVGKTSLLKVSSKKFKEKGLDKIIEFTCTSSDSFNSIFGSFLEKTNQLNIEEIVETTESRNLDTSINITFAKGGVRSKTETKKEGKKIIEYSITIDELAQKYCNKNYIFIIDEFDRVKCKDSKILLSETIKIISDYDLPITLIITGVSSTLTELLGDHESISRNLIPIHVPLMTRKEIKRIIMKGCQRLDINFSKKLISLIINLSNGLPYFAHLLSNNLCRKVIRENLENNINTGLLFDILKNTVTKVGDKYETEYNKALSKDPKELLVDMVDPETIPPPCVRELSMMAFALTDQSRNMSSYYSYLLSLDRRTVPPHYKKLKNKDIYLILSETVKLTKIIKTSRNKVYFTDSYSRGYVWLKAARRFGEPGIADFNNKIAQTTI